MEYSSITGFDSRSRQRPSKRFSRSPFFPSTSISMYLPIRTLRTSGIPRCRIASRTAFPWGSSTAAFGMTTTFTFIASPYLRLMTRTSAIQNLCFRDNLLCLFIVAQAEENRRPQFSVPGPLGEFDLTNKDRIYPMQFAHHGRRDGLHPFPVLLRRKIFKWTIVAFFGAEFLVQHRQ